MGVRKEFSVTVSKREMVQPLLPLQEHCLPMSNLDLLLPPLQVSVFFCYQNNSMKFSSMVDVLRKALAEALATYYPFAGEIVHNFVGEPVILCNNRGVEFTEAFFNVELSSLNLHNPDESVEGKLLPEMKHGVLSVQATELKCGGLIVACKFDHRIADAHSTNMFLVSWAEMAKSQPLTVVPSFRRSLLNPRCPPHYERTIDDTYIPISAVPPPSNKPQPDRLISRIFYITADQVSNLQSMASTNTSKRTKFESFSAFLWKMIARSSVERNMSCDNAITKMGIVVDGRSRLSQRAEAGKKKLMAAYFGNVISIPFLEKTVNEFNDRPLSSIADSLHGLIQKVAVEEHFLGMVDYVELHRPKPAVARVYLHGGGSQDGPAVVVSSGQRFPVTDIEFGWGKPVLGSYHFPWGGTTGYVMPMPSVAGNGDWIVYMHLMERQMEFIEKEAGHVFKPLTSNYLNGLTS